MFDDPQGQPAPNKQLKTVLRNGDQEILSNDTSLYREGSGWQIPVGSNLYVAAGNQIVMKYWAHNFSISENGMYQGRDDPGTCELIMHCEDGTIRYFGAVAGAKGTIPVFVAGPVINVATGTFTPQAAGGIVGVTTVSNANAGSVGELLTATIATPGTTLTTATPANMVVAGLSLTAGDWDVWANVNFLPAATTSITQLAYGLNTVTATLPAAGSGLAQNTMAAFVPGAIPQCENCTMIRVNVAATTPVYVVAQAAFTISTLSVFGTIYARRVR
jgi:hypothetical protein